MQKVCLNVKYHNLCKWEFVFLHFFLLYFESGISTVPYPIPTLIIIRVQKNKINANSVPGPKHIRRWSIVEDTDPERFGLVGFGLAIFHRSGSKSFSQIKQSNFGNFIILGDTYKGNSSLIKGSTNVFLWPYLLYLIFIYMAELQCRVRRIRIGKWFEWSHSS